MTSLTAGTVARAYLIAILVLAVIAESPLQMGITLGLLVVLLYTFYKPPEAGLNLVLSIVALALAPLALEALVGIYSALLIVPALLLVDQNLKNYASTRFTPFRRVGRNASDVLGAFVFGLLLVFVISVITWNLALTLATAFLFLYLGVFSTLALRRIPAAAALLETKSWSRTLVGEPETVKFSIKAKTGTPVLVSLTPVDPWVRLEPAQFTLDQNGEVQANLRFTPPLAGPSKIEIKADFTDCRGLIKTGQLLTPIDLHIIPKAKYATWLATKYLRQTSAGVGTSVSSPQSNVARVASQGVEFYGIRPYNIGDSLKNIDWKHSFKLGELITKEFSGAQGTVGIIVADLTAKDAEEADRLSYDLVMTALTLAIESLPSSIAFYNKKEVIAVTQPSNPRETLKKTLELTEKITCTEPKHKTLAPIQLRTVKRSANQLGKLELDSARKLSQVLMFEIEASKEAAKFHPATLALAKAVKSIQGPAVITVASPMGADSDALLLALERLKEKGYTAVTLSNR